ncbi:DUF2795 domain-containing protein [Streptomyces olivoreticuli]
MPKDDDLLGQVTDTFVMPTKPWEGLLVLLAGLRFPARKKQIIDHLKGKGLDEAAKFAEKLPDREYSDANAVKTEWLKQDAASSR